MKRAKGEVCKGCKVERYALDLALGTGGFGTVWSAISDSGHEVAIKILDGGDAEPRVERFFDEARAFKRIRHANVRTVWSYGTHPSLGFPYLVMELLDGQTVRSVMASNALPVPFALHVCLQAVRGLQAIHDERVVHRDIKPENLMLIRSDQAEHGYLVKVIDFGTAKLPTSSLSEDGAEVGTVFYRAPEQTRDCANVSWTADIYSLGCVLFEMIAGRPPFESSHPLAMRFLHATSPVPRFDEDGTTGLDGAQAIIDTMMAKLPAERPESHAVLIAQFERVLTKLIASDRRVATRRVDVSIGRAIEQLSLVRGEVLRIQKQPNRVIELDRISSQSNRLYEETWSRLVQLCQSLSSAPEDGEALRSLVSSVDAKSLVDTTIRGRADPFGGDGYDSFTDCQFNELGLRAMKQCFRWCNERLEGK